MNADHTYYVLVTRYSLVVIIEQEAKVVAAVWGTEFIQFLATIAILHQDDSKKRMNSFCSTYLPGAK